MTSPRLSGIFRRNLIFEWVVIGIIAAELLFFLWLLIHPALFQRPPVVPAGAPQVIASNPDQPAGGGLSVPGQPPQSAAPAAPAGSASEDDKGHQAAARGEDLHLYLAIANTGGAASLTGASSPQASGASLWQAGLAGAPASQTDAIPLAAGQTVALDDEHAWITLEGLTQEFKKGERIDVTLEFSGAEPVTMSAPIYRTRDTAAENPEPPLEAGPLTISAYWARPFSPGP
ncbi:MAG: copper chaperone PCu(A)C [Chloroflexota bacterium]